LAALEAVPTPFSKGPSDLYTRFILEHSPAKDLTARLVIKMQIPMRLAPALARGYLGRDFQRGPRGRPSGCGSRIIVIPAERLHTQRIYNLVLSRRPNSRASCTELHLLPQLECFRRQTRLRHRQDMLASGLGVAQVMVAVDEHGGSAKACGVATQEHGAQRKPMRRALAPSEGPRLTLWSLSTRRRAIQQQTRNHIVAGFDFLTLTVLTFRPCHGDLLGALADFTAGRI
jgi:hypothetical protein